MKKPLNIFLLTSMIIVVLLVLWAAKMENETRTILRKVEDISGNLNARP
jgi:hypothetical protein